MILSGTSVRDAHVIELKKKIKALPDAPCLFIIQIGKRADSTAYVEQKKKWGKEVGVNVVHKVFPEDIAIETVSDRIKEANTNPRIHGIIIQLPLPNTINGQSLIATIDPKKDVDGLTDKNQARILRGDLSGFVPATARGVSAILEHYSIPVKDKKVVVIGRSRLVGGPIAELFRAQGADVTVCHSKTPDTSSIAQTADILISAAGVRGLVTKEYVKPSATVIDVGINLLKSGQSLNEEIPAKKFVGDVLFDEVKDIAENITPVPGGVGPMTVISLLENVVRAYEINSVYNTRN